MRMHKCYPKEACTVSIHGAASFLLDSTDHSRTLCWNRITYQFICTFNTHLVLTPWMQHVYELDTFSASSLCRIVTKVVWLTRLFICKTQTCVIQDYWYQEFRTLSKWCNSHFCSRSCDFTASPTGAWYVFPSASQSHLESFYIYCLYFKKHAFMIKMKNKEQMNTIMLLGRI